jgi:predicted phage-related endonuclease
MALTAEAIIERRMGLGGSDAIRIMGTDDDWHKLWLEKTGRADGDDLSTVWPVQLGIVTEALNLRWYEFKTGRKLTRLGDVVICPDHSFLRCTLDGFDASIPAVIQAKHVNGFSKIEDVVARYSPQVTHEMIVTQAPQGFLSVIIGASEPVVQEVEYDAFFASEYIERCAEFWQYVIDDREPPGAPMATSVAPPKAERVVDFSGNNAWGQWAAEWLENQIAAKRFTIAVTEIKALIEADVKEAFGFGITASRSKAGAITIKARKS